jgi:hypothetical protein
MGAISERWYGPQTLLHAGVRFVTSRREFIMNILEAILGAQSGGATRQLGQQFGLNESQVYSALSALVPALAAALQKNTANPQGLDNLLSALQGGQHQNYLNDTKALSRPETVADGNDILGHIFGNKEVSRQVANRASAQTGIGEGTLKAMLPVVAALAMGAMSKQASQPAARQVGGSPTGQSLIDMLTPMLDSNRDGSIVDDVVGILGRYGTRPGGR